MNGKYLELNQLISRLINIIYQQKLDDITIDDTRFVLINRGSFSNAKFVPDEGHYRAPNKSKRFPRKIDFKLLYQSLQQSFAIDPKTIISDIKKMVIELL